MTDLGAERAGYHAAPSAVASARELLHIRGPRGTPRSTMRVLAINQFYAPDHAATSQLLTDLCEDLVRAGDEVTVVASRGAYLGGGALPARESIAGVEVVRPFATSLGKRTIAHRLADYGSFWASSVLTVLRERRPDVLLALTTPPMIAAGAALVAGARRVPLVTWVQDVYPDVAVAFGVLGARSPAALALGGAARGAHAASRRIVALSAGMADRLAAQGAARERLRVIPNWADGAALAPLAHEDNPFRRAHGLAGRFVAMYSGNLGVGHDVATLIEAARRLETRCPEVLVLFVGEGARRDEAERLARGLANVRFLPYQPRADLAASLSAADVHLVTLREGLDGLLVPSKSYGALACGRPIYFVGATGCEVARIVREHGVGWAGRPGDAEGLASALAEAARAPADDRARLARHVREVFATRFDRPIAVRAFRDVLREAARA